MATSPQLERNARQQELGFSTKQGVDWSEYLAYRPIYPASFFERIYDYHGRKSGATWSVAHDIGAGCGIVSAALAIRFANVIVSDPNDGYVTLARKLLVQEASLPESQFRFLQELAEESSVESGTVDLLTACECIHWTTPDKSIREFARELKVGGTLAITYYTRPMVDGSERVREAWRAVYTAQAEKSLGQGDVYTNAFTVIDTGLESVGFPEEEWENVKRVYINTQGDVGVFALSGKVSESKVNHTEERIWVEEDEGWCGMEGIEWFKSYLATWVPRTPESEMQDVWDELEAALEGNKVKIRTPVVMILAIWVKTGLCSADSIINILLCILGYIPGLLHAWYIISKFPESYEYESVPQDAENGSGGGDGRVTYVFVSQPPQPERQPQSQPKSSSTPNYGSTATNNNNNASSSSAAAGPSTGHHDDGTAAPPTYAEAVKGDNKIQTQD
ncbi:hypothetical protein M426DRAFT_7994 [Hypoxylon sp. CI-4A]|nr:hypothetical protein M426DRAFT_7994 [Hypoxylon sp. CI-4A]